MAITPQPLPPSIEVYAVFCGSIEPASVQRFFQSFAGASNPTANIKHIHLLFQSTGGFVGDGVCLYNFLKTLPIDLTIYNVGAVFSIATIAYLGAKKRKTSTRAVFGLHSTTITPQGATSASLEATTKTLILDDARTQSILRDHVALSDEQWTALRSNRELVFSGEEAINLGIAHEIGEFSPPKGVQIFNI